MSGLIESFNELASEQEFLIQLATFGGILTIAFWTRLFLGGKIAAVQGEHVLHMSALNDARMVQEVFMTYLGAAILEPILSIADAGEDTTALELLMNGMELLSILWWIWLLTDAFDFDDVVQFYKYHVEYSKVKDLNPDKYKWFVLKSREKDAQSERRALGGSLKRDIAIWFNIACITAAWMPGGVTHFGVIHAYFITFFWIVLHHSTKKVTTWHPGYLYSFLFPSSALLPLEYCLPLMDGDTCEDLDFIESWREFVLDRTGVSLTIMS